MHSVSPTGSLPQGLAGQHLMLGVNGCLPLVWFIADILCNWATEVHSCFVGKIEQGR